MKIKSKDKNNKININAKNIARTIQEQSTGAIVSDTTGGYTGTSIDGEQPVQDSDDL